jgi:hypothetical protein
MVSIFAGDHLRCGVDVDERQAVDPENVRAQRGDELRDALLLNPLMIEEMVITVVTPMTIPRTVKPERSLLALRVSRAIFTDSLE